MINAAIVGMGRWGQTLVNSVADGSYAIKFISGTTRTLSKVEEYAAEKNIRLHATYEDVMADDEVDAVVLASPHSVHFDQMMAAADAGKHVFCEKPFCLTGAEAKTALDAIAAKGLKVAIGHNRRFSPNAIRLKQMIDAGELGGNSSLRRLIEGAKNAAALPCYRDEGRDLAAFVDRELAARHLTLDSDARAHLLEHVGADRALTRAELDKLALYLGPTAEGGRASYDDPEVAALRQILQAEAGIPNIQDNVVHPSEPDYAGDVTARHCHVRYRSFSTA